MNRLIGLAVSALISMGGLVACNKTARQESAEDKSNSLKQEAQQTAENIKEEAKQAAADVKEGASQTASNIKEGANEAADKIKAEAEKAGDALKEGADKAAAKTSEAARQTSADIHETLTGDRGKTPADEKLNVRIRTALKASVVASKEAGDVKLDTKDGHVTIVGTVASSDGKKEIAHVARKVAGLTHVDDDIKIAQKVGQAAGD